MAQGRAQIAGAGLGIEQVAAQQHGLDIALDVGQGRAQIVRDIADQLAALAVAVLEPFELLRDAQAQSAHGMAKQADLVVGLGGGPGIGVLAKRLQLVGQLAQRPGQLLPGQPEHDRRHGHGQADEDGHRAQGVRVGQARRDALRLAAVEHDVQIAHSAVGPRDSGNRKGVELTRRAGVGAEHGQEHAVRIALSTEQAAHRCQIDLRADRAGVARGVQCMGQHAAGFVQQVDLHCRVDLHHVQREGLHAGLVGPAIGRDQAQLLVFDDVVGQAQVHALPGFQSGLRAVVLQQHDHRCAQGQQQGCSDQRRANMQLPPQRPTAGRHRSVHALASKR